MARKLSKKKISRWLLLFAAIVFYQCDGHKKVWHCVENLLDQPAETAVADNENTLPDIDEQLAERLDAYVAKSWRAGSLGVYVWDETANRELYAFNADSLMRPASNMKMLTCIAALRRMGPNHTFNSTCSISGTVKNGVLTGDVAFQFGFDPTFNAEHLRRLVAGLARKNIREIKGKIIVDAAIKEAIAHEEHWTPGDLKARKLGLLHRGETRMANELKYALAVQGVKYNKANFTTAPKPKGMKVVSVVKTPMRHSVQRALLNSSNEHAEALAYPLSWPYNGGQNFRSGGTRYLQRFVEKELGVVADSVCRIHDTSGLCVHNRLSPRFLVRLLHYAYAHKYIYAELRRFLPVSGQTGTLHDRMWRPATRGRIQAKTGTLTREDGITSLSGYVTGANGHLLLFSIIQNEMPVYDARIWQDKFCAELVK